MWSVPVYPCPRLPNFLGAQDVWDNIVKGIVDAYNK